MNISFTPTKNTSESTPLFQPLSSQLVTIDMPHNSNNSHNDCKHKMLSVFVLTILIIVTIITCFVALYANKLQTDESEQVATDIVNNDTRVNAAILPFNNQIIDADDDYSSEIPVEPIFDYVGHLDTFDVEHIDEPVHNDKIDNVDDTNDKIDNGDDTNIKPSMDDDDESSFVDSDGDFDIDDDDI